MARALRSGFCKSDCAVGNCQLSLHFRCDLFMRGKGSLVAEGSVESKMYNHIICRDGARYEHDAGYVAIIALLCACELQL